MAMCPSMTPGFEAKPPSVIARLAAATGMPQPLPFPEHPNCRYPYGPDDSFMELGKRPQYPVEQSGEERRLAGTEAW